MIFCRSCCRSAGLFCNICCACAALGCCAFARFVTVRATAIARSDPSFENVIFEMWVIWTRRNGRAGTRTPGLCCVKAALYPAELRDRRAMSQHALGTSRTESMLKEGGPECQ